MQGISSFPFQTSCIFPESFLEITFNGCYIACHFVGISGEVGSNVATRYGEPNTHLSAKERMPPPPTPKWNIASFQPALDLKRGCGAAISYKQYVYIIDQCRNIAYLSRDGAQVDVLWFEDDPTCMEPAAPYYEKNMNTNWIWPEWNIQDILKI